MIAFLRWCFILAVLAFTVGIATAQAEEVEFPAPIYWDANAENTTEYGVYSSSASCTDPDPSPTNCVAFTRVATVGQAPDPVTWTEPGPVTFDGSSTFYRITGLNSSGGESAFSNELEIIWREPIPGVPGNLRTATTVVFVIRENGRKVAEVTANFYSPGGLRIEP